MGGYFCPLFLKGEIRQFSSIDDYICWIELILRSPAFSLVNKSRQGIYDLISSRGVLFTRNSSVGDAGLQNGTAHY